VKQEKWKLTPEQEVIVGAVRADRMRDSRIRELIQQGLDWPALCRTALRHGVLPVVSIRLEELGQDLVPEEEIVRLKQFRHANLRRSLVMTAELLKIITHLDSQGLAAIPFKGPVLAVQAYGDSGLRQFADLDLLVRKKDLRAVGEQLAKHGYSLLDAFTPAQERAHLKHANEVTFSARNGAAFLDVHWQFAADYLTAANDPAGAFERQTSVLLEGRRVPALAAGDMLFYLCLNGLKYTWAKLSLLCDIARVIESDANLDWEDLLLKAETAGIRRAFLLGIALARDILGTSVPASIPEAAGKDRVIRVLRERARIRLFERGDEEPGFLETARFQLPAKDRLSDRISYCFIRAFFPTAEDWKLLSLPDSLYFLYYFIRPLRLAGLYTRRGRTGPSSKTHS